MTFSTFSEPPPEFTADNLWDHLHDADSGVLQTWPADQKLSLFHLLERHCPDATEKLRLRHEAMMNAPLVPVIAVAGSMNAGKSSLVRSFLSDAGKARVLIGATRSEASHRPTLWHPPSWQPNKAIDFLTKALGLPPEPLSDDPVKAKAQQGQDEKLHSALYATDSCLEDWGMALLDCPDIQRPRGDGLCRDVEREAVVEKLSHFCSGAIIVARDGQTDDKTMERLLSIFTASARFVAVNRVSPDRALEDLYADLEALQLIGEEGIAYVAYDFRDREEYDKKRAPWDRNPWASDPSEIESHPVFFEIGPSGDLPREESEGSLTRIWEKHLVDANLHERHKRESEAACLHESFEALHLLMRRLKRASEERTKWRDKLCKRIKSKVYDRKNKCYRMPMRNADLEAFKKALEDTMPADLRLAQTAREKTGAGVDWLISKTPLGNLWTKKQEAKKRMQEAKNQAETMLFGPNQFRDLLMHWYRELGHTVRPEEVREDAESALKVFTASDSDGISHAKWTEIAEKIWDEVKWKDRAKIHLFLWLPFLGVALIPFDGGTTLILVSIPEFFGAAGVAGLLLTIDSLRDRQQELMNVRGGKRLINLQMAILDQLALPRPPSETDLPLKVNLHGYGIREKWQVYQGSETTIKATLEEVNAARKQNS